MVETMLIRSNISSCDENLTYDVENADVIPSFPRRNSVTTAQVFSKKQQQQQKP